MDQPIDILRCWFAIGEPIVRPVTAGRGFSGARHWQVEHNGKLYILRQWPEGSVDAGRLAFVHDFQMRLASHELPVPVPALARDGQTFVKHEGRFWEVATWMPGSADYWSDPRPEKLAAALQTLAEIHRVSELEDTELSPWRILDLPNALEQRCERLNELIGKRALDPVSSKFSKLPDPERRRALETLKLIERLAPRELLRARQWQGAKLPLATCLRDIWHDHVLFTGDRVTGIIDFGAVAIGSPASDIARLLGSMVGDDRARWAAGLAAYESVRPLTDEEREAVQVFDSTGIVLSAANWLLWLYGPPAARLAGRFDRAAALSRFHTLMGRLRNLAAGAGI
jgi:Ser/Thr protein kinase RdoA (MazF antagonist)